MEKISDKIKKLLNGSAYDNSIGGTHSHVRRESALYIAAYKQLKRRGAIAPFRGHRDMR